MTKFYESQPAELPLTLPKGTTHACGVVAATEVQLRANHGEPSYFGVWGSGAPCDAWAINIVWSSVPITPPVEDRPIQAGDWVEHKTSDVRYQVEHSGVGAMMLRRPNGELLGPVSAAEFERVDGPHPVIVASIDYGSELGTVVLACHKCGGYHATTYTLFDGARVDLCRHCWLNASPAVKAKPDPYTAHRLKEEAMANWTFPRDLAARARNEAALRREAETPRGNPAERKSLAAGHPISWPSNEGED